MSCLLINFWGLVLRLKSARDSFVLKSSAQFEGSCEKEIAVEVTVMVVGSKFLFLSSVSGKGGVWYDEEWERYY